MALERMCVSIYLKFLFKLRLSFKLVSWPINLFPFDKLINSNYVIKIPVPQRLKSKWRSW